MGDNIMLLLALGFGVLLSVAAYPIAKRYIPFMRKQKAKHPGFIYTLASLGSVARWAGWGGDEELNGKVHPWLPTAFLIISIVCLVAGLVLGYWEAWVSLAIMIIAIIGAFIIAIRNSPGSYPVNKPKK